MCEEILVVEIGVGEIRNKWFSISQEDREERSTMGVALGP